MKKYALILFALVLFAGNSYLKKIDTEKEKEAIIAVIEEETNGFLARDYDRIAATCVNDETFIRLQAGKNGYDYIIGWKDCGSYYKEIFMKNTELSQYKFENSNYKIKIYPESAWAAYEENWYKNDGEFVGKTINVRFLEKVKGEWKIVYLSPISAFSYEQE